MRNTRLLSLILLAVMMTGLQGCIKNRFTVKFDLPATYSEAVRLKYFATSDKQSLVIDMTLPLNQGKGETQLPGQHGTVVSLIPLTTSKGMPELMFYAERGNTVTISGTTPNPIEWKVGGNDINERWSEWRLANLAALKGGAAKSNQAIAKYVEGHKDDPVSTLLLLTTFDRRADDPLFRKLWGELGGKALDKKYTEAAARADMSAELGDDISLVPEKIEMYVRGDSMMTVSLGEARYTLLYFWDQTSERRKELLDSLKALRKEHPSDTLLRIVDISFFPDTVSWRHAMIRDSVNADTKGWTRGWVAGADMNPGIRGLEVTKPPLLLLLDDRQEVRYRGASVSDIERLLE